MDIYSAVKLYEHFDDTRTPSSNTSNKNDAVIILKNNPKYVIVSSVISVVIGLYAVYLSWSCNSALGLGTGLKLLYALFAFIFGLLYLIFYLIFRAGTCKLPTVYSQGYSQGYYRGGKKT